MLSVPNTRGGVRFKNSNSIPTKPIPVIIPIQEESKFGSHESGKYSPEKPR